MKDSVIVITGSSRGLGKALAESCAKIGAKVVISGRNETGLKETAEAIGASYFVTDVTKESDVEKLAGFAVQKYGRIDIWINNAGIWLPWAPLEEVDLDKAHEMLEVNLFGTVYGAKYAVMAMKRQGSGKIVNIVSTAGLAGRPLAAMYCASKFAVRGLTDSLREEVKDSSISVIGVYPGGMKTDLFEGHQPPDFGEFMEVGYVADKIVEHLNQTEPGPELIIRRPGR